MQIITPDYQTEKVCNEEKKKHQEEEEEKKYIAYSLLAINVSHKHLISKRQNNIFKAILVLDTVFLQTQT